MITYTGNLTGDFIVDTENVCAFVEAKSNYKYHGIPDSGADYDHSDIDSNYWALFEAAYEAYWQNHQTENPKASLSYFGFHLQRIA